MRIGRTIPPAAAPLCPTDLVQGLIGLRHPERSLRALEEEVRRHFGVRHVFLVSSGTAALTLTLKALASQSQRTGVVIPAYTCFSVPGAVLAAGLRPVLCDISPTTFDFDHALLERALGDDTLCVVAHHLFGVPSDIDGIRSLCRARGINVVEDAAQAMGAESKGRLLGTLGDAGIFSLGRGKHITCGSGGIIVTSSDRVADAIRRQCASLRAPSVVQALGDFVQVVLMAAFIRPQLYWIPAALPCLRLGETIFPTDVVLRRLSGMQAGLLHHWRRRLSASNRMRSAVATEFSERLSIRWAGGADHPYLRLPVFASSPEHKRRLCARSQRLGLGLSAAYPGAIDEIPEIIAAVDSEWCPMARYVAERLLTVPTHHWLAASDKRAIAECLGNIAGNSCPPERLRHAS